MVEPELVSVQPADALAGEAFEVRVRPRTPARGLLGTGQNVQVTTEPGRALDAADLGDGSSAARFTGEIRGAVVVRVTIDGVTMQTCPKVRVR